MGVRNVFQWLKENENVQPSKRIERQRRSGHTAVPMNAQCAVCGKNADTTVDDVPLCAVHALERLQED